MLTFDEKRKVVNKMDLTLNITLHWDKDTSPIGRGVRKTLNNISFYPNVSDYIKGSIYTQGEGKVMGKYMD